MDTPGWTTMETSSRSRYDPEWDERTWKRFGNVSRRQVELEAFSSIQSHPCCLRSLRWLRLIAEPFQRMLGSSGFRYPASRFCWLTTLPAPIRNRDAATHLRQSTKVVERSVRKPPVCLMLSLSLQRPLSQR